MIAIDTNVLVRYLVEDDAAQTARAAALIEGSDAIFVGQIVLCEVVWVLSRAYRQPRGEISRIVGAILRTAQFHVQDVDLAHRGLDCFSRGRGDFADYLVAEHAARAGCEEVATFDRVLLDEPGFVAP